MADDTHECPIDGCASRVPFHILMCRAHWRKVPRDLQREVYRTWREGDISAYMEARDRAIHAVEATA